jgi:predicted DNA-binding protein (MmcQ/YjbR family)
MKRTIREATRELLLAFPEVEEFESHGSPNYRAKKGKVFAVWALNHHGDGKVALWLNTPAAEQGMHIASARQIYKPPYVGPSGWIGVELNKGFSWKRLAELVRAAYVNASPAKLVAQLGKTPAVKPPTVKMKPADIDRLLAPQAQKALAGLRAICSPLPEVDEALQFGSPVWRVGKRAFAMLYDYGQGLHAGFWVGIERQGPLEMDPRFSIPAYLGHLGWIALDLSKRFDKREIRELAIESYRHFATRRAIAKLEKGDIPN